MPLLMLGSTTVPGAAHHARHMLCMHSMLSGMGSSLLAAVHAAKPVVHTKGEACNLLDLQLPCQATSQLDRLGEAGRMHLAEMQGPSWLPLAGWLYTRLSRNAMTGPRVAHTAGGKNERAPAGCLNSPP